MRKNKLVLIAAVAAVLLVATIVALVSVGGGKNSVMIDGEKYDLSAQTVELSGKDIDDLTVLGRFEGLKKLNLENTGITIEEYREICGMLPECVIEWSVPVQGQFLNSIDTREIVLQGFTEEDAEALGFFSALEKVHVKGCSEQLAEFAAKEHPYEISCTVMIGGKEYDPESGKPISITNPDVNELKEALAHYPNQLEVALSGKLPDDAQLLELKQACPNVDFAWDLSVYGVQTNTMATELTLDNIQIKDTSELESKLPLFNQLEVVNMNFCGISDDEMDALRSRHPETKIVWTIELNAGNTIRSDAEYFMTAKLDVRHIYDKYVWKLKYCKDLICVDLGHQSVTDLSFLEELPHVQYLVIAHSEVTDISFLSNMKELRFLEMFITRVKDYSPLLNCTNLEYLNISYATRGDITPIAQMTWLDYLWAGNSNLDDAEKQLLKDSLPDTHITFYRESSTNYGWRHCPGYFKMRDILDMFYMTR